MFIENVTEQVVRLTNGCIVFAHENTRIVVGLAKLGNGLHILCRDMAFVNYFVAYIAISAIHGDVSVYQASALKFAQIIDDKGRATGGNEYLDTLFVRKSQGLDGGGRDDVCLEAYQRTVDIKKQCFRHNVPFGFYKGKENPYLCRM